MKTDSLGRVRTGQLLTTFGPGSVVDLSDGASYLVKGLDEWRPGERVDEPNLESILHVRRLSVPASDGKGRDIPVTVFPRWHHCPNADCGRLIRGSHCRRCNLSAPPARFIIVCRNGHLDDFPWCWWVHEGNKECPCDDLVLEDRGGSNSLGDLWVECGDCGDRRSLAGALEPRSFREFECPSSRPWLGDIDPVRCERRVTGALRGASNVYFANVLSALSLPRHGSPLHVLLKDHWATLDKLNDEQRLAIFPFLLLGSKYSAQDGLKAFNDRLKVAVDAAGLRRDEYEALAGDHSVVSLGPPAPYFEAVEGSVPLEATRLIERIILVRRLREVSALRGFTRLEGPDPEDADSVTPAPISRTKPTWLPAREVYGEGIFFMIREDALRALDADPEMRRRAKSIDNAYRVWRSERELPAEPAAVTARKLLIHTLAHLLVRELSLSCGYGVTSLRERVYANEDARGFLVYTASADSDGSLGGLVRMGDPKRVGSTLASALEGAAWCSQDPLCFERPPDPGAHLSGAACHACLLLPETSCEMGNRFLDRVVLRQFTPAAMTMS